MSKTGSGLIGTQLEIAGKSINQVLFSARVVEQRLTHLS